MVAMPNRVKVVVVMSALALATGLLALALGAKPTQAQAETDKFNDRATLEGVLFNECTGEFVSYEGTEHFLFHIKEDASGGFHIKAHTNTQVQGVSTSGAKYVAHQIENSHNLFSESADNFSITSTLQIIRQGSDTSEDDFQAKGLTHVTVNANGEVTSEFEQFESECK
jgi:phage protein U